MPPSARIRLCQCLTRWPRALSLPNTTSLALSLSFSRLHTLHSNVFQVNASTTRAVVYNDRSVLENHHLAAAFLALESEENNFTAQMPRPKFREFRHGVIELVLATDLAQHFKILSQFKAKVRPQRA
jgi:hypothetical protein